MATVCVHVCVRAYVRATDLMHYIGRCVGGKQSVDNKSRAHTQKKCTQTIHGDKSVLVYYAVSNNRRKHKHRFYNAEMQFLDWK